MADASKPEAVKPGTSTEETKLKAPVSDAPTIAQEPTVSDTRQAPPAIPSEFVAFAESISASKKPIDSVPVVAAPTTVAAPESVPSVAGVQSAPASEATKAAEPKPSISKEIVPNPDPEEDGLDDLDDILDEFSEGKQAKPATGAAVAAEANKPPIDIPVPIPSQSEDINFNEEDFASQLQAGMADLLSELQTSPELQKEFESLVKEFGDASGPVPDFGNLKQKVDMAAPSSSGAAAGPSAAATGTDEPSFQDSILRAMQRMQESGQQASAAAAEDNPDDILAELLKQMQAGDLDAAGGEEGFSKLLLGMMEQLTNKEILYEPMKELHVKFPEWIEKNGATLSKEDLDRYSEQRAVVAEIVERFESPTYSDSNATDREYIVERMQKMQAAGSPPPDLVGDMSVAQDALNDLDAGCPQQ